MSQDEVPVYKAPEKEIRIIDCIHFDYNAPTLVVFAGVHGNETAGVLGAEEVFSQLQGNREQLKGNFLCLMGNIPGLQLGQRFIEQDLNRMWTKAGLEAIQAKKEQLRNVEEKELLSLFKEIAKILSCYTGPIYFVDIHTTSGPTVPFITINDALINRKFSRQFPLPVILGIEEYLEGPLLSYINEMGYVSLGFESGQHQDEAAIAYAASFLWLALLIADILPVSLTEMAMGHRNKLRQAAKEDSSFYEVIKRFGLDKEDQFIMTPGFKNFDKINKGAVLASYNGTDILSEKTGVLFMPLYQEQGEEGFFLIRSIPEWILKASEFLRSKYWNAILGILPGISKTKNEGLKVNSKIAIFLRKPIFHLLGFRSKPSENTEIFMSNREITSKKSLYKKCFWMK